MDVVALLLAVSLQQAAPTDPLRVVPGSAQVTKTVYREVKPGEERVQGLLQRVECPPGRPVTFVVKLKDRVAKYQAPRLDAVEYIAHTSSFRGPMSCGGRMPGDPVFLTWKTAGGAPRVIAVEFLPKN
jgi:hypothetical protein